VASDPAGRVVDEAGKGVAGATVWAIGRTWDVPEVTAQATCDTSGRFTLLGAWKDQDYRYAYASVFARAPDGRCSWISTVWSHQPESSELPIELIEVGDVAGRVVDQDGKPIAGALVTVAGLDRTHGKTGKYDMIRLPLAVAKPYQSTTEDDGRFVLKGIPRGAEVRAEFTGPEIGKPLISWDTSRPVDVVLDRRTGSIDGRFKPPAGQAFSGTLKLALNRLEPEEDSDKEPFHIFVSRTVTVSGDGTFRFEMLPPGRYSLSPDLSADAPFAAKASSPIEVKPGAAIATLEIPLTRIPIISGRIVDVTTGAGIAGVSLVAYRARGENNLQYGNRTMTDSAGNYKVSVEPGIAMIQPDAPPKSHMGMAREACPKLEVKADRTWPDLKLVQAVTIDGEVVDASGKPVSGAEVNVVVPDVAGFFGGSMPVRSERDGSFPLEQLDPDDRVPVRARTSDAATNGAIVIQTKEQKQRGKLTVTIDPQFAFRVKGRVVDQRGKPVAGVPATLWWSRQLVSEKLMKGMGYGSALDALRTDQDGRFVSRAVWPGDRYKVSIESKVYARAETPEITGAAGEVHDFGTISLVDTSVHVAGRVLGSDGKPIAGARVFNRGDGSRPTATETAADGRFQLEGLFSGSRFAFARRDGFRFSRLADALAIAQRKFVFVRKEGYRFTGVAVDGEGDHLTIQLLRTDEYPPAWRPQESAPYEDQKALAKRTLIALWEKCEANKGEIPALRVVNQMAEIDPEQALTWSAGQANRFDEDIRIITARRQAETDAASALKRLNEGKGIGPVYALQQLADRFLDSDHEKAKLFAAAAAARARALNQHQRTTEMARAGAALVKAGDPQAGRKLIEEAAGDAEKLGTSDRQGFVRGTVAQALALLDLQRALTLIEPITERRDKDRYIAFIIESISATNPEKALSLVESLDANNSMPQTLKTGIAYAIAPTRPDDAIKVVEGMKEGYSTEKHQTEAFGWLSVAIAPKDKEKAYGLIDRALAIPIDKPEPFGSYSYFGGALASSAGTALNARKIGYPDMSSALMWVMAARPDGQSGFRDPAMQTLSATIASPLVALLDPAAARTILGQLETRSGLSAPELAKIAGDWWLAAWALADLKHAEGLVDAALAALDTEKPPGSGVTLLRMTEVLLTPPDRREDFLREKIGASWRPGFTH
jgi:protocatechuate 3,4-dioxygenase beta subunit